MEETIYEPHELLSLDPEILQPIALELDVVSALNLCVGAKALKAKICNDDIFWQAKYKKDFGIRKVYEPLSWFENYKLKASGFMSFEYEKLAEEIYVKFGNRTFIIIPDIEHDFESPIAFGLEPTDILTNIKKGTTYWLSTDARLNKRGTGVVIEISGHSGTATTEIILRDAEAIRLIKTFYEYYQPLI